ncbi:MAG: hypothetical protein NW218_02575 [Saprospiraceae bacterium]|nr:hypothetical protein [Saprospiraceae bacterium]
MEDRIYYGITQDWKCVNLNVTSVTALKNNPDLKSYRYILEQIETAQSNTGQNIYYKTRILNTDFQVTSIEFQGTKILNFSDEYWLSIGSFDIEKVEVFRRKNVELIYDSDLFPYINYLSWFVKREESSFKICIVKFRDALGYEQSIRASVQDESAIERLLSLLIDLSLFGSFSVFKLILLLRQMNVFKNLEPDEKERAKAFFLSAIDPTYKKCKELHPNAFHDIKDLEEAYKNVRGLFFD